MGFFTVLAGSRRQEVPKRHFAEVLVREGIKFRINKSVKIDSYKVSFQAKRFKKQKQVTPQSFTK